MLFIIDNVGIGCGVGFLSDYFKVTARFIPDYSTFESRFVEMSYYSFLSYVVCLHRPPGQPANFFGEFNDLLENFSTLHSEFYIFGDFNLQLDKRTAVTIIFDDILTSFDFVVLIHYFMQ